MLACQPAFLLALTLAATSCAPAWHVGEARARGDRGVRVGYGSHWSAFIANAYAPRLLRLPGWQAHGRAVTLLLVHYGAAAEEAWLLTLDRDGLAQMNRAALADTIEVALGIEGHARLLLRWRGEGGVPQRNCLDWNGASLLPAACP